MSLPKSQNQKHAARLRKSSIDHTTQNRFSSLDKTNNEQNQTTKKTRQNPTIAITITTMRVFISNIDTPLGYNVSRVLSQTLIGSRRPKSEEEDLSESEIDPEDTEALAAAEAHKAALEAARNTPYTILGSLFRNGKLTTDEVIYNPRPGKFVETGDLERDVETKDLIEKFAVRGNKPAWISEVVDVGVSFLFFNFFFLAMI